MFDNLLLIAILVIVFWLSILIFYLYTSRQQQNLQADIETLRQMLDQGGEEE